MHPPARLRSRAWSALTAGVLALVLTGCGGSGSSASGPTPTQVMAAAKKHLDTASSVHLDLSTSSVPKAGNAVLSATGDLTHAPAFRGEVKVLLGGLTASVPVTAVGGKVYARLPLQMAYSTIDPTQFGAPDPSSFADPDHGVSSLLTRLAGLKRGSQTRNGSEVLTSYAGTLSGKAVQQVIPSASAGKDYRVTVGVDSHEVARTVAVTGPFFSDGSTATYRLELSRYGDKVTIVTPKT